MVESIYNPTCISCLEQKGLGLIVIADVYWFILDYLKIIYLAQFQDQTLNSGLKKKWKNIAELFIYRSYPLYLDHIPYISRLYALFR